MDDLRQRATKIFGTAEGRPNWPYGLHDPQWRYKQTDPARYAREVAEQPEAQRVIVEWAERYGLRETHVACCPRWLLRSSSSRCAQCWGGKPEPDEHWLDHTVGWLLDRRPVAMTSAPYGVRSSDRERLAWWAEQDERLRVMTGGQGWYGYGTTQVLMWRADRIAHMETAPDARRGLEVDAGPART